MLTVAVILTSEKYVSTRLYALLYIWSLLWFCNSSILSSPPHSSIAKATLACSPTFSLNWKEKVFNRGQLGQFFHHRIENRKTTLTVNIFKSPSKTTPVVFQSLLSSILQNGGNSPMFKNTKSWYIEQPLVKLVTAHAASLWDL